MDNLVISNIRQRPVRTLISVIGVALGVILVALNTGLIEGILNDRLRRDTFRAAIAASDSNSSKESISTHTRRSAAFK
jgi:hypothetical protein